MSRRVVEVKLSEGQVAYLRVQNAAEFLEMGETLGEALDAAGDKVAQRHRVAMSIKLKRTVCDATGNLVAGPDSDGSDVLAMFSWPDALTLIAQVNKNNGLSEEDVTETEKKTPTDPPAP